MKKIFFGNWKSDVHDSPEQYRRISAGSSIKIDESTIKDNSCSIRGSSIVPCEVTLNSCSCIDFARRGVPCKHIYCFAIKKGYIDSDTILFCQKNYPYAQTISANERSEIFKSALSELEKLSDEVQIKLQNYLYEKIYHENDVQIIDKETADAFIHCNIVTIVDVPFRETLCYMKKNEIVLALKTSEKKAPSNLTKNALANWCVENTPEIQSTIPCLYYLTFTEEYLPIHRKLYLELVKKFRENNIIWN